MKELHKRSRNLLFTAFENLTLISDFFTTKFFTICTPPQFHAIHNSHWDSCINTVGDTISMQVKPWFSAEAGTDFLKRENGGVFYYTIFGDEGSE